MAMQIKSLVDTVTRHCYAGLVNLKCQLSSFIGAKFHVQGLVLGDSLCLTD